MQWSISLKEVAIGWFRTEADFEKRRFGFIAEDVGGVLFLCAVVLHEVSQQIPILST